MVFFHKVPARSRVFVNQPPFAVPEDGGSTMDGIREAAHGATVVQIVYVFVFILSISTDALYQWGSLVSAVYIGFTSLLGFLRSSVHTKYGILHGGLSTDFIFACFVLLVARATADVLDKYMPNVPMTKGVLKGDLGVDVNLDLTLVKNAVQAHGKAVDAMCLDFVTPLRNHENVTIALTKMFTAAPKNEIKVAFDTTPGVRDLNAAWYAQMPQADAQATFETFVEFAASVRPIGPKRACLTST